jgi:uncharacterized protein YcfJ
VILEERAMRTVLSLTLCALAAPALAGAQEVPASDTPPLFAEPLQPLPPPQTAAAQPPPVAVEAAPAPTPEAPTQVAPVVVEAEEKGKAGDTVKKTAVGAVGGIVGGVAGAAVLGPVGKFAGGFVGKRIGKALAGGKKEDVRQLETVETSPSVEAAATPAAARPAAISMPSEQSVDAAIAP